MTTVTVTRGHEYNFIILLLSLVFIGGCDLFQVSFDRENPLDPDHPGYLPQQPTEITVHKSVVNPRNIDIRWESQSIAHDGFLIEKSTGNDQSFNEIARVVTGHSTFLDISRDLAPDLWYRVTSYIERDGELRRHLTDPVHIGFGGFTSVEQAWLARSTARLYRFGINWRDDIQAGVRDGYEIVAIREDGEEFLLGNINPPLQEEYSFRESYEGADADQYRSIRVDAYYLEDGEKRLFTTLQAELEILF